MCDLPLGMTSGHIDDCQLDGSIENDPARPPSHGRYNGNSGQCKAVRTITCQNTCSICRVSSTYQNVSKCIFPICLKSIAWRPFSRGPTFSKFRYFQVFFGNKTLVNKIVMQKGAGYTHHPSQLSLRYSNDGYSWQTAETV